jgi:hypothetical protein
MARLGCCVNLTALIVLCVDAWLIVFSPETGQCSAGPVEPISLTIASLHLGGSREVRCRPYHVLDLSNQENQSWEA